MAKYILSETENGVAKITLNNPVKLNSFNRDMAMELQNALDECAKDKGVRAVLLTGAGRAFCAGQDLAEVIPENENDPPKDLGETVEKSYNPIVKKIRLMEKPVICAVNGVAAGAGANLAVACDVTYAAQSAKFIQSFRNIGVIPDSGGTYILPKIVGMQRALGMMFTGEKISAEKALEYGMIYKVCEDEKLMEETMALAKELAQLPTRGFALTKRGINRSLFPDMEDSMQYEMELQREAGYTKDYSEGVQAFLEKRKPVFKGE